MFCSGALSHSLVAKKSREELKRDLREKFSGEKEIEEKPRRAPGKEESRQHISAKQMNRMKFDAISTEISEREEFLQQMSPELDRQTMNRIRGELKQRYQELCDLEKELE